MHGKAMCMGNGSQFSTGFYTCFEAGSSELLLML